MSDLRTLPTIIAHAEAEARVRQDGLANRWPSIEDCPPPTWASMAPAERQFLIDVELDLACDLSRPASRDAVARLVAAKLGIECGATAPEFTHYLWGWQIGPSGRSRGFCGLGPSASSYYILIPGIHDVTDPTEALRLIALHVLRELA